MKKSNRKGYIGRTIRWSYFTAATSCCTSRRVQLEGVVTAIRHNPTPHFGPNTLLVRVDPKDKVRHMVNIADVDAVKLTSGTWCPTKFFSS